MKTGAIFLVVMVAAGAATAASAQDTASGGGTLKATVVDSKAGEAGGATVCTQGKETRRIELMTEGAGKAPCTVHYKKETEQPGHDQVIYTAKADTSFCETKAQAFADKLTGMGWSCSRK